MKTNLFSVHVWGPDSVVSSGGASKVNAFCGVLVWERKPGGSSSHAPGVAVAFYRAQGGMEKYKDSNVKRWCPCCIAVMDSLGLDKSPLAGIKLAEVKPIPIKIKISKWGYPT